MSFFTFLIVWLICFFIAFFSSTKTKAFTSLIGFICEGINLYMFSKAHSYAKKQVEKAVLNSIQEEVHFDLVPENDLEANDKETINDVQENKGKDNENYYLHKKTSKVLDTTSVELPPPLMPASNNSENKAKSEESKEQVTNVSDHENDIVSNTNDYNDNDKNEEDDVDFY